ncbi:MAG: hypothetical protein GXY19_09475 [Phycisphaerae bacterium]|nr:hypothetical protein [Phycisphaerae bacterium]
MSPVVSAFLETLGVVALAGAGVLSGLRCSRWRQPWWLLGYVAPLLLMIAISLSRWWPRLEQHPPFEWVMAGRVEFALLAVICTLLLTTPLSRLSRRRDRVWLSILMVVCVMNLSVLPFLAPAMNYHELASLQTTVDYGGVCIQGTGYTCGPAAAVTALRVIGIEAEEGELAILAHTTRFTGTQPDVLCHAIMERYGVPCRQVHFCSISELCDRVPVIAVVKFAFLIDHFVTVLDVAESVVVVGDPLQGRIEMTHEEFTSRWRRYGIVLRRSDPIPSKAI